MMDKMIACFLDTSECLNSFSKKGEIVVYKEMGNSWAKVRETSVDLEDCMEISVLREKMKNIIQFLDDCKVIVTKDITGIPFFSLEQAGFEIWEWEGKSVEVLPKISEKILQTSCHGHREDTEEEAYVSPVIEEAPGIFKVSLKEFQGGSGMTSKQILMPILLGKAGFTSLEVSCLHIPPWFELMVMEKGYNLETERKSNNELKVVITK